jgi:tetratricopeptide (TPR) repeat protein
MNELRATRGRAACLILALLVAGTASAIEPWEYRTNAAEFAFANGDFERAEAEFRGALELAQKMPQGDPRLEISLDNLARFFEHQSRFEEAQPHYLLLQAAQENRLGPDHPALFDSLLAVARVSIPIGDTPTAEASLERYLEIAESTGAADPDQHWRVLSMFARMKTLSEENEAALALQRRAVEVMRDNAVATGLEGAAELETLAQMELVDGSAESAEALLIEAVKLRSEDGESGRADALATAAATALGANQPEIAGRLAERALEAARAEGGDELPALKVLADASWLQVRRAGNLGDLIGTSSDDPALITAGQRLGALAELQSAALPPGHPDRLETMSRLVRIEALLGEVNDAANWQRRFVDEKRPAASDASPAALSARNDLVTLLAAAGRADEAVAANATIIQALEATHGPNDARLVAPLERQHNLLVDAGRKKEARAIRKRLKKLTK